MLWMEEICLEIRADLLDVVVFVAARIDLFAGRKEPSNYPVDIDLNFRKLGMVDRVGRTVLDVGIVRLDVAVFADSKLTDQVEVVVAGSLHSFHSYDMLAENTREDTGTANLAWQRHHSAHHRQRRESHALA